VAADVAIAPVTSFRSARATVRPADIRAIAAGDGAFDSLVLVEAEADAILAALERDRGALGKRLVAVDDAAALRAHLAQHPRALGFLRADDVDPSVRALAWGGTTLFGVDRVAALAAWPLTARLPVPAGATPAYDPGAAWTMVAGGDILLDRGVHLEIEDRRRGANFPWDGGTVDITGRCKDCSVFGWDLPYTKRTGNGGAVRDLFKAADLAIANFENPAPDRWRFHAKGTVFSADPAHLSGLVNAGIDWVSLANNHIGDAGRSGILQTMDNLDDVGIRHGGTGRDGTRAHQATLIEVGDVTVGILGYDTIAAYYHADADTAGSANMTAKVLKRDIAAARKAGADVVVVFPHWGVEYQAKATPRQQRLGRAAIDAGADLVIGNHPHWAGAMETYKGRPIWYALGNLVFDQTWSEYTMEGLTLELTFSGRDLVQARMRPHLILDRAQPNFLDPAADGKFVMNQVFRASGDLLDW
jgi:poly-gamma-glutamate synthesis protein (capsule biosynthesis protein)